MPSVKNLILALCLSILPAAAVHSLETAEVEAFAQQLAKQTRLGNWLGIKRLLYVYGGSLNTDTAVKHIFDDMKYRNVDAEVMPVEAMQAEELRYINLLPPEDRAKTSHAVRLSYEDKRKKESGEVRFAVYEVDGKPRLLLVALDPDARPDAPVEAAPANETIEQFSQRFARYVEAGDWPNIRNNFYLLGSEAAIVRRRNIYKSLEGKKIITDLVETREALSMDRKAMGNAPAEIYQNTRQALKLSYKGENGGWNVAVPITKVDGQYKILVVAEDYSDPADAPYRAFAETLAGHLTAGRWEKIEPMIYAVGDPTLMAQAKDLFATLQGAGIEVLVSPLSKLSDREKARFKLDDWPADLRASTPYAMGLEFDNRGKSGQGGALMFPIYDDNGSLKILIYSPG